MAKLEVSDEMLEHIAEVVWETTQQIDCRHEDVMVEIFDETPKTMSLTDRILERYTPIHQEYFQNTLDDKNEN